MYVPALCEGGKRSRTAQCGNFRAGSELRKQEYSPKLLAGNKVAAPIRFSEITRHGRQS